MLFEAIAQLNQKFKPAKNYSKKKPATFKANNFTKKFIPASSKKSHNSTKAYQTAYQAAYQAAYNKSNTLLRRKELKKAIIQN